mgnify:CR=1 FL=1
MRILITGACGLIGRVVSRYLASKNHTIIGLGRSLPNAASSDIFDKFLQLDLSSRNAIELLEKSGVKDIDIVIHCASQQPKPDLTFSNYNDGNIKTLENIVQWSKESSVKSLISFSTISFLNFPSNHAHSVNELTGFKPNNYYSLSKLMAEMYLNLEGDNSKLTILCFRIPSLVHEEQKGGLIYTYWYAAQNSLDLEVFDNGITKRSLIHVNSILSLLDKVIVRCHNFNGFNIYNVGTKDSWTILEIASYIFKKNNSSANIKVIRKKSVFSGHCSIDNLKVERDFNFTPWTTKKTLDTYLKNMNGD